MKNFMKIHSLAFLLALVGSASAQADELLCASGKNENLYYGPSGQILFKATIANEGLLENARMTAPSQMGFSAEEMQGKKSASGKYMKFKDSDAWCNYTLTLPVGFMARAASPLFLDAKCEGGTVSDHRLSCKIE
jgi:hypothetical protein